MLPATVDTAAELSGERQGESSTPRQSHCHVGGLASSVCRYHRFGRRMDDDVIRVAVGLRLGANLCVRGPTHVHMRCPPWMPVGTQVGSGLQEKRRASPPPRPAQRRRVACDAACPGPVPQGTRRTQQVRREAGNLTGSR